MKKKEASVLVAGATVVTEDLGHTDERDVIAPIRNYRGMQACLKDGWRIFALNARRFAVQLLPAALVAGIGITFLLWAVSHTYAAHVAPALLYLEADADAELVRATFGLQWKDYALLAAALLCCIACLAVWRGSVWTQIARYADDGMGLAKGRVIFNKIWARQSLRCLLFNVVAWCAFLVVAAVVAAASYFAKFWYLLFLLLPIGVCLMAIVAAGRYAFLVERLSLRAACRSVLRSGLRHWGGHLVLILLTGIPLLVVAFIFALPYTIFPLSYNADAVNLVTGELSGLPTYMTWLDFAVGTVAFTVVCLASASQTWALAFKAAADYENASATQQGEKAVKSPQETA